MEIHLNPHDPEDPKTPHFTDRITFSLHIVLLIVVGVIWLIRLSDEVKAQRIELEELKTAVFHRCRRLNHGDDSSRHILDPLPKRTTMPDEGSRD